MQERMNCGELILHFSNNNGDVYVYHSFKSKLKYYILTNNSALFIIDMHAPAASLKKRAKLICIALCEILAGFVLNHIFRYK
jgi:hypothetical protein